MSNRESAIKYAHDNRERYLTDLKDFLSIKTVSTDPDHKADMEKGAEWVANKLKAIGINKVEVMPTGGHPVVYCEYLEAGDDAPTMVIYGHYDVQPVEPLDLWESDPFAGTERDENLYARGASDMKAQVLASINAVEALMQNGGLGVNIKFLIEGEEEIGSPNLDTFIEKNKDLLACDFALNPDAGMLGPDTPTITYALRGLAYFEVHVEGPDHDLHSGIYGGSVRNPVNELARLIGGMMDENGHITLPGYYDSVRDLDDEERAELARLPVDDAFILENTGAPAVWGEAGYSSVERVGARPTLDVNGIYAGFIGEGSKTVLPSKGFAKISMRLVPDQNPDEVHKQLEQYMQENANPTVKWEVRALTGGDPSISDRNSRWVQSLAKAQEEVWGVRPVFKREGGSVPVVAQMQQLLGVDSVLCGYGLPDDNLHAPNEKLHLPTWYRGNDAFIHMLFNLAE
ncbi:MAG: dipeptidase [Chloroflexi bacterium]|nr:MAG: dipeptidase [Chloroflexota bacterium]MBL1195970.1 dipeptidase [Chloroflexota bacterium]NOH13264.1 dipeptidase [Chloroflexota bacterium]